MSIRDIWEGKKKEKGEEAYKDFESQAYDNRVDKKYYCHFSNEQVEGRLVDDETAVRLKPESSHD